MPRGDEVAMLQWLVHDTTTSTRRLGEVTRERAATEQSKSRCLLLLLVGLT